MARRPNLIPICLGSHESGDAVCDGDQESKGPESQPCSWRDRCVAFRCYLDEKGEDEDAHLDIVKTTPAVRASTGHKQTARPINKTHEEFLTFVGGLASLYNVRFGVVGGTHAQLPSQKAEPLVLKPVPSKQAKKPTPDWHKYLRDPERKQRMRDVLHGFLRDVRRNVPRDMVASPRRLILTGMLYVIDRRVKSGYMSVYCRAKGGDRKQRRDIPVVIIYQRIRSVTLNVGVAADIRHIQKVCTHQEFDQLAPKAHADGSFRVMFTRMDATRLTLLSQVIGRLVTRGILGLPAA